MKEVLRSLIDVDLTNADQLAQFLVYFIYGTKAFRLYLGSYYVVDGTITYVTQPGDIAPCYIEWSKDSSHSYLGGYLGGFVNPKDTGVNNAVTVEQLSTRLKTLSALTFTLVPLPVLIGVFTFPPSGPVDPVTGEHQYGGKYEYVSSFRLAGKWLKLFGINPFKYTNIYKEGKYLNVSALQPLVCRLQNDGYNMLYLHSNFAKSVSAASTDLDNNYIVPTNILWPIQIVSNPNEKTYFVNYNTAGKVSYFMPIMEEIEVYFTDEWGDRLTDYIDFQLVLTFDFAPPEPLPEPNTIKRARRELNM